MKDNKSTGMVFVCGCGHSGTSLITAMLGAHKDVYAITEETGLFTRPDLADDEIRMEFQQKYAPQAAYKNAKFLCEKTPKHLYHLPRIRSAFPGAHIIILVRDARDVALSIKNRTGNIVRGYTRWVSDNSIVQQEHRAGLGNTYVLRYEDLIENVEGTLREICDRLGIPYDPMMLLYHQDKRTWFGARPTPLEEPPSPTDHVNYRNWQIKHPVMDRRGQWRTQLDKSAVIEVQSACRELMEYFGYPLENLAD